MAAKASCLIQQAPFASGAYLVQREKLSHPSGKPFELQKAWRTNSARIGTGYGGSEWKLALCEKSSRNSEGFSLFPRLTERRRCALQNACWIVRKRFGVASIGEHPNNVVLELFGAC